MTGDDTGSIASSPTPDRKRWLDPLFAFCLDNKLVVFLLTAALIVGGLATAPFDWEFPLLPRAPVAVDAIPDIGENQQIVFTSWPGRSPEDVEDQITYPLTTALMGIPKVRDVRSLSMFGFSTIYLIFEEDAEFYWSRSRVLEKLASLPGSTLPEGVEPSLGPDATALGQVFWYTLEGRDPHGQPVGGWGLDELRSIQDWTVRYALQAADGVAEVASVGGFVRQYQVDVDPAALRAHGVTLEQVLGAVRQSNLDVGARTLAVNRVEYVIRGRGFVEEPSDLARAVVSVHDNVPIYVDQVATVSTGPALRRGALDKGGAEAVGGAVVVRYGTNPLAGIKSVKAKIAQLAPALPRKAVVDYSRTDRAALTAFAAEHGFAAFRDGRFYEEAWREWLLANPETAPPTGVDLSQVTIVPFYDRTGLIYETLGTLQEALELEVLVTVIVVILMVMHLRSSLLIAGLLPLAVLITFILMKGFGIDANIVALSGIAIAIGTMVDMGVVLTENILAHLQRAPPDSRRRDVVLAAVSEVGGAVLTAVLTTVIGFLPVFFMIGAEGKLFRPLAFTKTFALLAAIVVSLTVIPPLAHLVLGRSGPTWRKIPPRLLAWLRRVGTVAIAVAVAFFLAGRWLPLGPEAGWGNHLFVFVLIGALYALFQLFIHFYDVILHFCLRFKALFLTLPLAILIAGAFIWRHSGREFMPPLDEGSFLYMPTTMTHASIGEALDVLRKQDQAISAIPEVEQVVGKIGRVDSALDPAPISMVETVITYKSEYRTDEHGRRLTFAYDHAKGEWRRDPDDALIEDGDGLPYRQWRPHIASPDDIWDEIVAAAQVPGSTAAPKLQPIAARIVMLATGMRAPIGIKIYGPDLRTIEEFGKHLERHLKDGSIAGIDPATVYAERIVGKPYLEIVLDRERAARYGVSIVAAQRVIQAAIGGSIVTETVEGRERYGVQVRYARELRDDIDSLDRILIPGAGSVQVPLGQIADIEYVRGPQAIKSEDTRLVGYLTLDIRPGNAEVEVVEAAQAHLAGLEASGELSRPAGVAYEFAGNYQNQQRAAATLMWAVPLALLLIFLVLYFQFASVTTTLLVFTGVFVAWAGGFIMLWAYGQDWFLNVELFGRNLRQVFQVQPINLSVAVWVGFLALFGIATDDGVIIGSYIKDRLAADAPTDRQRIRACVVAAGARRIRPALMTVATTILALIPVLTSTGRGSDIMVPMAIPTFGGMTIAIITVLVVPTLYSWIEETKLRWRQRRGRG